MINKLLYAAMALLTIDGVIELGFIASTVQWLHVRAGGEFIITNPNGGVFSLHGKPLGLLVDQGHASNGAAGTAFIIVGLCGSLILFLRHRKLKRTGSISGLTAFLYNFWLVMTVLSATYSLAAFIYTFTLTYQHDNQNIDINLASRLNNKPHPNYVPYPELQWTPQNWFAAVLQLPLADDEDRSDIQLRLRIMHGWQWNLIPLWIFGFVVMGLAVLDRMKHKQVVKKAIGALRLEAAQREKAGSSFS